MLFALVVISTVLGIAIPRINNGLELHLKTGARKMASTIRFAYNESVTKNRYYRLVFSMPPQGEHSFWLEVGDKPYLIRTVKQQEEFERKVSSMSQEERQKTLERESQFTRIDAHLTKGVKLPRGVRIQDVFVSHQPEKIEQGEAYLYFFPNGSTEQAYINISDTEGDVYSLEVYPLSGKVITRREYLDHTRLR